MDKQLERRIRAAKGEIPFDKLFINARIINTYTHRILENGSIGVVDGIVASVCPSFKASGHEIIDLKGMYIAPSFIDAHMHIESSHLNPIAYAKAAIVHGTGCIMTDPMQLVNAVGDDGLFYFLDMLKKVPMRSYLQFPSKIPAAKGIEHSGATYTSRETIEKLRIFGALTLGEVNACNLTEEDTLEKLRLASNENLMVNGHCPNLSKNDLMAAASAHIRDDHECETSEEAMNRLDAGISVLVREGTIEPNCRDIIKGIVKENIPCENLMFCTDDKSPKDMVENGCIDHCIRIAVSEGLNPVEAICMATINPAKHFHLEDKMGVIAPGRYADFVSFDSLNELKLKRVYFAGKMIVEDGKICDADHLLPDASEDILYKTANEKINNSVKLPVDIDTVDLSPKQADQQVVISMTAGSLMTKKELVESTYDEFGRVVPDIEKDFLPIAVIDRYTGEKHIGTALIHGLQMKKGAVASSCAQEANNIVVSGCSYEDMLLAVKQIEKMGGGNVVVVEGKIVGERKLPIGGIISDEPLEKALVSIEKFNESLKKTGSENDLLLAELTVSLCPSIPEIGLTDMGIIEL